MDNNFDNARMVMLNNSEEVIKKVFNSSFGQTEETIRASFKKTVQIREYETEVVEGSTELKLDRAVSAGEREIIMAMLRLQLEYEAYVSLLKKGLITQRTFDDRKLALTGEVVAIRVKVEGMGIDVSKYFN